MASDRSNNKNSNGILVGCFLVYVIVLAFLTTGPAPVARSGGAVGINLVPLTKSIRCFVPNPGQPSTTLFCLQTIIGNMIMFVPFGVLLPLVSKRIVTAKAILVAASLVSLAIEAIQFAGRWFGSRRWTDIDDVLFNVLGALVGYALLRLAQRAARLFTS